MIVFRNNAGGYSVRVGSTYFNQGGTIYYVSELHPHPNDDIGLVKLSRTLSFGRTVKPITLASEEPRAGSPATVSGWGGLSTGGPLSVTLQALDQRIGGRFGCFLAYGFAFHSRRICAVNPIDNAGTCFVSCKLIFFIEIFLISLRRVIAVVRLYLTRNLLEL